MDSADLLLTVSQLAIGLAGFSVTAVVGFLVAVLQIAIAITGSPTMQETVYIATLVWHLYAVFMAFTLLLYQLRKRESKSQ